MQLIVVGSCGLHTLHNAFKGASAYYKVLQALHYVFHNTPAGRKDFTTFTKWSVFPLPFCGHRWIDNLPVVSRAIEIWPTIEMSVDAVTQKKLPKKLPSIIIVWLCCGGKTRPSYPGQISFLHFSPLSSPSAKLMNLSCHSSVKIWPHSSR